MSGAFSLQSPQMLSINSHQQQAPNTNLIFNLANITNQDKAITPEHWEARKQAIEPSRTLINQLIMNYLVVKGYKEGALKFQKEAGIQGKSNSIVIIPCS